MKRTRLKPRSDKPRYNRETMQSNMNSRWEAVGRCCENCGALIPDPGPSNFAHVKGRNVSSAAEIENDFFVVCEVLHRYEHTRAKNLQVEQCVDIFRRTWMRRILNGQTDFWPDRLPYSPADP